MRADATVTLDRVAPEDGSARQGAPAPLRPVAETGVLVLCTGYRAGPWAMRSLRSAGYRVVGAHHEGICTGGRSRACPRPRRYPSPTADPEGFIQAVAAICASERISVVLPASEDTARVMAERRPDLGGAVVVGPDRDAYAALCDKGRLATTAALAGVDHPRTVVVGMDGPDGPWPELPNVVKPRISGEDIGGLPAAVYVRTPEERDAAIEALIAVGNEAVVQEELVGQRWVGQSVRDADGSLDIVASRIDRDYPRSAGVASVMRTVAEPPAELVDGIRRLLDLADYRGPSTISLIATGDRWAVHDVNLRLGSSVALVMRSGLDMPRRAVEVALGAPAHPAGPCRPTTYVRLDGELGATTDALRGRGEGDPARRAFGHVASALTSRDAIVDPFPFDPFWLANLAGGCALQPVVRGVRALRRRGRS